MCKVLILLGGSPILICGVAFKIRKGEKLLEKNILYFVYYFALHRLPQDGLFINNYFKTFNLKTSYTNEGRDSSARIATGYGLDGPGIESRWGRDFSHPSRAAHPASCKMGTGSSPCERRRRRGVDCPPHLTQRLRNE